MQNLQFADALTSNQRTAAYRAGQIEAEYRDHLRTAEIKKSIAVNQQNGGKRKEGRVVYEDGLQESGLSEEKKTAADVAKLFSRASGVTIHLFESRTVTVDGETFHTRDGKTPVQNGWYRNGEIWIDLNSGMDGRGIAVYTIAHELTHFIRQWSPSHFRSLSNFLVKTYEGKSVSITGLIRNQQAIARKNGQKLGYDEAWEEVVANSMESTMKDGKGVEAFLQLQQQNPTLWQKIKAWFADLVQRMKNMTVKPDSAEANLLIQLTSEVDRMAKMWATGVYEAGQNFQNANGQKNTAIPKDGTIRYDTRERFPDAVKKLETISDQEYLKDKESTPFLFVMQQTPSVLIKNGKNMNDRPVIMRRDAAYLAIRKSGVQEGHYHGLGADVVSNLPDYLNNPSVILDTGSGRRLVLVSIPVKTGQAIISVVFESTKDIESKNDYYNVVVTMFDLNKRYLRNQFTKYGATIAYKNEALAQVNPQLLEWLETINAEASNKSIRNNSEKSNTSMQKNSSRDQRSYEEIKKQSAEKNAKIDEIRKTYQDRIANSREGRKATGLRGKIKQAF